LSVSEKGIAKRNVGVESLGEGKTHAIRGIHAFTGNFMDLKCLFIIYLDV
jgi:hypothetical protein